MSALAACLTAGKLILVMDAECALCSWGARTIAAHDRDDLFRIAPLQSPLGRSLVTARAP